MNVILGEAKNLTLPGQMLSTYGVPAADSSQ
jgi:hypothetical protein